MNFFLKELTEWAKKTKYVCKLTRVQMGRRNLTKKYSDKNILGVNGKKKKVSHSGGRRLAGEASICRVELEW